MTSTASTARFTAHGKPARKTRHKKTAGPKPRRCFLRTMLADQRSSWSTLCCDWLASDSAETAIDWRVDSAWLFAASTLVSARVRLDEPVWSTLIRFFLISCRTSTTERFEPRLDASERSVLDAALRFDNTLLVA